MKVKKKITKILAIVCCCKFLLFSATPAHAFWPWPVISPEAIAEFIYGVANGISQISTVAAEVQNYA